MPYRNKEERLEDARHDTEDKTKPPCFYCNLPGVDTRNVGKEGYVRLCRDHSYEWNNLEGIFAPKDKRGRNG